MDVEGLKVPVFHLTRDEEVLVFSDVHFGLRFNGRELSLHEELAEFLESVLEGGEHPRLVVLLGDIFELWSASLRDVFSDAFDSLRLLSRLDSTIVFVPGNHDRVTTRLHLESLRGGGGFVIAPEIVLLDIDGKKVLLFHGHQLDGLFLAVKGLWKLQSYVYIFSESLMSLPGPLEWVFAAVAATTVLLLMVLIQATSLLMEAAIVLSALILLSPMVILLWRKAQDKIWYGFVQPLASRLLKSRLRGKSLQSLAVSKPLRRLIGFLESFPSVGKLDLVVFGHTHVPEYLAEGGRLILNTGSWVRSNSSTGVDNKTYVRIKNGKVVLAKWEGSEIKIFEASLVQ